MSDSSGSVLLMLVTLWCLSIQKTINELNNEIALLQASMTMKASDRHGIRGLYTLLSELFVIVGKHMGYQENK